ncbi:MAG: hypothetical protein WC443_08280 [Desulfobaccales bacterium]
MGSAWHTVAFPVILPWRDEFWTLPLYFPDLKLGVIPGWPSQLPYQGLPLPAEAEIHPRELEHYKPGDLRQWRAFADYQRDQGEEDDMLKAIRGYGQPTSPETPPPPPNAWALAWQLEKMQADQDAQLLLVDKGQDWLKEILTPEPWDERASFGPVPGIEEMVDPELAQLRYQLWRRVMAPFLEDQSVPLLLGRTSRALFLTLKGWPDWTSLKPVRLALPGCRNGAEWLTVCGDAGQPPWQRKFIDLLADFLTKVADQEDIEAASGELQEFVEDEIVARWPFPAVWNWNLEIWPRSAAPAEEWPILCWSGAGAGILPG